MKENFLRGEKLFAALVNGDKVRCIDDNVSYQYKDKKIYLIADGWQHQTIFSPFDVAKMKKRFYIKVNQN